MPPTEPRALCVSIHDVAPETWPDCACLQRAIEAVADIPLTWLVVPRYHGSAVAAPAMERTLDAMLAQGHELALHGYTHLDSAAPGGGWRGRFLRNVYTTGEGEFAAIDAAEARQRIALGLAWFSERGWPAHGFVPPAWLLSGGAWNAVREAGFDYTTTFTRFHLLKAGASLWSPSLVYTARNTAGRLVSPRMADALAAWLAAAPLVRLSLHPADARHPALVRHAQRLVARLLADRQPLTKAGFAAAFGATVPIRRRLPSATDPSLHKSGWSNQSE
ncbi:polysaccharide deacetylase family protein [Massilia sp. R2A-15]|uniref:polysaccharide deacetylase family protein n=1 Tax=Massilia sp. R2A-15 TaxID=3064278 RepID=UPI0027369C9F|nr:polysaccharide deacetylase family protein [Massilia sp. R2A-15]WLI90393.1 polysaccharide deacetylase family protein [Massilia sp. R2A-15]